MSAESLPGSSARTRFAADRGLFRRSGFQPRPGFGQQVADRFLPRTLRFGCLAGLKKHALQRLGLGVGGLQDEYGLQPIQCLGKPPRGLQLPGVLQPLSDGDAPILELPAGFEFGEQPTLGLVEKVLHIEARRNGQGLTEKARGLAVLTRTQQSATILDQLGGPLVTLVLALPFCEP